MAHTVIMPRQGQSVESCIITGFNKQIGEHVSAGDILFSYETDKAAFDEEAKVDGTLLAVFFSEGDDVPCLEAVCVIGEEGEEPLLGVPPAAERKITAGSADTEAEGTKGTSGGAELTLETVEKTSHAGAELKISPRARCAALRVRVNPALAKGTGPDGRIIERDILDLAASGVASTSAAVEEYMTAGGSGTGTGLGGRFSVKDAVAEVSLSADTKQMSLKQALTKNLKKLEAVPEDKLGLLETDYVDEPLSNMRKKIAASMHNSLASMAQLTHNASFDATDILALRKAFKDSGDETLSGITLNDILLYAVSRTLVMPEHSAVNAHFLNDKLRRFSAAHIGMAVDTPRGLMVPTLFNANKKSLREISDEARSLAKSCVAGNISPDNLQGGTFTVSNLGALEIESFTPVINPPQTGILGVNTITYRPREDGSIYPAMTLSLTYDHRALDGAPASRFLRDLKRRLERFSLMLAMG